MDVLLSIVTCLATRLELIARKIKARPGERGSAAYEARSVHFVLMFLNVLLRARADDWTYVKSAFISNECHFLRIVALFSDHCPWADLCAVARLDECLYNIWLCRRWKQWRLKSACGHIKSLTVNGG